MSKTLDLLLKPELPNVLKELPEKRFRVRRLSDLAGEDVIFTLRGLPYGKVKSIQEMPDMTVQIVLAGCADPDWKAPELLDAKQGIATPADVVKSKLNAGEIDEISIEIQKLTGYRQKTIDEIKNS